MAKLNPFFKGTELVDGREAVHPGEPTPESGLFTICCTK